jgi:group I intron endonuclease
MPPIKGWKTGVYCWRNLMNGKVYVGSAEVSLAKRKCNHLSDLRQNIHCNIYLQRAWNKYGQKCFKFVVLERCRGDYCVAREQYWMDALNCYHPDYGYNLSPTAGNSSGYRHTDECKKRMGEKQRLRAQRPGERERLSRIAKEQASREEVRKQSSERHKKLWKDPEWRANQVAKRKGIRHSPETKAKRNDSLRRMWAERRDEIMASRRQTRLKNRAGRDKNSGG